LDCFCNASILAVDAAATQVRDAFRRFMAAQPDAWDYSASDIPSPLTEDMEAAQQSKKVCASWYVAMILGDGWTCLVHSLSRAVRRGVSVTVRALLLLLHSWHGLQPALAATANVVAAVSSISLWFRCCCYLYPLSGATEAKDFWKEEKQGGCAAAARMRCAYSIQPALSSQTLLLLLLLLCLPLTG
jgi:hypothetical protein